MMEEKTDKHYIKDSDSDSEDNRTTSAEEAEQVISVIDDNG